MQLELAAAARPESARSSSVGGDRGEKAVSRKQSGDFKQKLQHAATRDTEVKSEVDVPEQPVVVESLQQDSDNGEWMQALQVLCSNFADMESSTPETFNTVVKDTLNTLAEQVKPETAISDLKMTLLLKDHGMNMLKVIVTATTNTGSAGEETTALAAGDAEGNATPAGTDPMVEEASLVPETFKGKLMFHHNKNKTQLKIQVQSMTGEEEPVENSSDSVPVKKLMNFESRRLNLEKLTVENSQGQDLQLKPEIDQGDDNRMIQTTPVKETTELPKGGVKISPSLETGKFIPVDADDVFEQIVDKAKVMVKQNLSEMKLDLKPEFLGRMTIKVMVEEGVVTARFITDSPQVKQMLESNLNTLRQNLEMNGIKVEKTEVNVQLDNSGLMNDSGGSSRQNWELGPQYRRYAIEGDLPVEAHTELEFDEQQVLSQQPYGYDSIESQMSFLV